MSKKKLTTKTEVAVGGYGMPNVVLFDIFIFLSDLT